ncbi:hypothetical protein V6X63_10535 [Spiribacter sp. 221]|uniref:hypothetical protein n=1 Tax=Spiribacter onubensis TaxID=3122420 RepID=UPI00349FD0F8
MGTWKFNDFIPSDVEVELTQKDQFDNDEVDLRHALVREAIQNSGDAPAGDGPVKVRFGFTKIAGGNLDRFVAHYDGLRPHLRACEIDTAVLEADSMRSLVIEDFNTKGLTGAPDDLDDGNFHNFWRRHGKSKKSGKAGGRWGLGKLVYPASSQIRAFYGLTVRDGDTGPLLMGQAVLENHKTDDGKHFKPHGFWYSGSHSDELRLQLPIIESSEITLFREALGITRTDQTGLSIAVPFVHDEITEPVLIEAVLENYFFPLLTGRLEVEVGSTLIDRHTFMDVAAAQDSKVLKDLPFDFIREVSEADGEEAVVASRHIGPSRLDAKAFPDAVIEEVKQRYKAGKSVCVHAPVSLTKKDRQQVEGTARLFLRALPEGHKPYALFSRGSIVLPGERRYFADSAAYGAFVVDDDDLASFLGDAENPAHTSWNGNAEKLSKNWSNSGNTLRAIRYALRDLYTLVAEQVESHDADALVDFFSLAEQSAAKKGKKRKTPKPDPDVTPREPAIRIQARKGGFRIASGPAAKEWTFPRLVRARLAYDLIGADPFKRHSVHDFDLTKNRISLDTINLEIVKREKNALILKAEADDFSLDASGFDDNRDLVVEAWAR